MALFKKSSFDYDRVGMDSYLELDTARAHMEREQKMLMRQMQQMQDMYQRQMYPMYQSGADWSTGTSTTSVTTTAPRTRLRPCNYCGRPVEEGAYCSCQQAMTNPYMKEYKADYGVETPGRSKCPSCGEKSHRQDHVEVCDRTKGLLVQKRIKNFRKLYWHRRAKNPELFETKHD